MVKHRTHSIEFKRQVVQEFLGGESPHALAKRHGISRNLIKIWVAKYDAGGLDSDDDDADVLAEAAQLALSSFKHVCAIFAPCPGLSGVSPQSSSMTVPAGYWGSPHVAFRETPPSAIVHALVTA